MSIGKIYVSWWRHQMETFSRYWPFVRGIYRWPANSPPKGQGIGVLMFSLICAWMNASVNSREASDLKRHRAYYDVIVIFCRHQRSTIHTIMLTRWLQHIYAIFVSHNLHKWDWEFVLELEKSKPESRHFETSLGLSVRRPSDRELHVVGKSMMRSKFILGQW